MEPLKHKNKIIGYKERRDDKLYITKKVNPKEHKMKIFNAYGIQETAFKNYIAGNKGVITIKEDDGYILRAPIKVWEEEGFVKNMGHGEQRFLQITKMDKVNYDQPSLL